MADEDGVEAGKNVVVLRPVGSSLYVRLGRADPESLFTAVSMGRSVATIIKNRRLRATSSDEKSEPNPGFGDVIADFRDAMASFHVASDVVLMIGKALPHAIVNTQLREDLKANGRLIKQRPFYEYYEVSGEHLPLVQKFDQGFTGSDQLARRLPSMMLSALIAQYDAFLARLIETIIVTRPEVAGKLERSLTLSELMSFATIEDARDHLVEKEAERVLRGSHDAQLEWFKDRCGIDIKSHIEDMPQFFEVCERRNLAVHTDSRISSTYLSNCARLSIDTTGLKVGNRLYVSRKYYRKAVSLVYEVGFKLGVTVWERLAQHEQDAAESEIIRATFELIQQQRYKLATRILEYFVKCKKTWHEERNKLMCIVNFANAVKLGGDERRAKDILAEVDWSATSRDFKICVAAVRDDADECALHMRALGVSQKLDAAAYKSWPVFESVRKHSAFLRAYEDIFGAPIERTVQER